MCTPLSLLITLLAPVLTLLHVPIGTPGLLQDDTVGIRRGARVFGALHPDLSFRLESTVAAMRRGQYYLDIFHQWVSVVSSNGVRAKR